jgi:tetratricopeptide (TPR) repeat protein
MLTMSTKYPDLFSKALEYLDTGNYDEAITQLKNIISKDDNQSDAWYNLGLAYYRKADYENSIRSYEKATNIDNEYSDAWYNLGITYRDRAGANNNNENDLKNALKYFDMALAIDKNPNFFGNKGLVEEKLGLNQLKFFLKMR